MRKIVLTGGGTAGHVTPNIALIPHLQQDGWIVHYIGTADGIERSLIEPLDGVEYHIISSGKLRRYFSLKNFTDPFRVIRGIYQSRKLIKQIQPLVVFSKGGFVSVPVSYGASSRGVPVVLHESDSTIGLANRISMRKVKVVCVSFEPTLQSVKGDKGVWTGSPIRDELMRGDPERARQFCGFARPDKPWIMFMGGSLGAEAINVAVDECMAELCEHYNIVHIRGRGKLAGEKAVNRYTESYRQYEYINEQMADLFAAAGLVVCRSGANTLFELLALCKPSLLVPLPLSSSRGDQIHNARYFETKGFSHVLPQEEMDGSTLPQRIAKALSESEKMAVSMQKSPARDGTRNVLEQIYNCAGISQLR